MITDSCKYFKQQLITFLLQNIFLFLIHALNFHNVLVQMIHFLLHVLPLIDRLALMNKTVVLDLFKQSFFSIFIFQINFHRNTDG